MRFVAFVLYPQSGHPMLPVHRTAPRIVSAVVRQVASTLPALALREYQGLDPPPIDLSQAIAEHHTYIQALRTALSGGPTAGGDAVTVVPADDRYPDCVFVEDTAVVLGGMAVLTNPGALSRRGEGDGVRAAIADRAERVVDMCTRDPAAGAPPTCDGGDVLWTGRHLFVGVSGRTNAAGAAFLAGCFEGLVDVVTIRCLPHDLHLKCVVTHIDGLNLIAADTPNGRTVAGAINASLRGTRDAESYRMHWVTDAAAANVLRVNGTLFVPQGADDRSWRAYEKAALEAPGIGNIVALPNGEFGKCDGSLTCRSILFSA